MTNRKIFCKSGPWFTRMGVCVHCRVLVVCGWVCVCVCMGVCIHCRLLVVCVCVCVCVCVWVCAYTAGCWCWVWWSWRGTRIRRPTSAAHLYTSATWLCSLLCGSALPLRHRTRRHNSERNTNGSFQRRFPQATANLLA